MNLFFNVLTLAFEVIYYSMFIKLCKKEGKFIRYISLFTLITIMLMFIGTNQIYSYLVIVLLMLYGLKYIVKIKVSLYDMLLLFLMLLFKIIIEYIVVLVFFNILKMPISINIVLFSIIKIVILYLLRNKMYNFNKYFNKEWVENNFYVRYIFTILVFVYVIISCITIIIY